MRDLGADPPGTKRCGRQWCPFPQVGTRPGGVGLSPENPFRTCEDLLPLTRRGSPPRGGPRGCEWRSSCGPWKGDHGRDGDLRGWTRVPSRCPVKELEEKGPGKRMVEEGVQERGEGRGRE